MSAIDQAFIRAYQPEEQQAQRSGASSTASVVKSGPAPPFRVYTEATAATIAPPREEAAIGRRPLSAFAQPGPTVESQFKPSLEVDGFHWSPIGNDLVQNHKSRLRPLVQMLLAADDAGRSLIGVMGAARGVGCTTLVGCLARLLVQAGKTVAIVDGDFTRPALAQQLGLAVETGWEDVLSGRTPLAEAVVHSLDDSLALLPLVQGGAAAAEKLGAIHASVTAGVLRYHYDMVLFDLGAVGDAVQGSTARRIARQCRLDGVVLTSGLAAASTVHPQRLMQTAPELAAICLGVVENQLRAA